MKSGSTRSKARSKTSAFKPKNMTLFIVQSHSLSFLNTEEIPAHRWQCKSNRTSLSVHSLRKHQSKESSSWLPWLCQVKTIKFKKKKRTKNIYRRKGNKPKPTSRLQLLCAIWMYRKCMRLWVLEELGLLFHVVAFPQGKPVKLLDLHSKDVKERFRC